jgi:hypothetical protein
VKHLMSATFAKGRKAIASSSPSNGPLFHMFFVRVLSGGRRSKGHLKLTNSGSYSSNFIECFRVFEINFLSASKSY